MTLFLAGVLIALGVSALCSVMEATLLSLTPAQVAGLSQRRPRLGRIWQGFKSDVERPIAVILLMNTTAHTVGASVAGAQFGKVFGEEHLWLFAGVFTFLMLQFTEILAKSLGVRFNRDLAVIIGRPLHLSTIALQPVLWFIHLINRPFERRRSDSEAPATVEEITALAGLARLTRQISPQQERIIATAPRLSEYRVRDLEVGRDDIAWLRAGVSLKDGIARARHHAHTRFPVCEEGDLDRVIGYVNVKEMLFLATDDVPDEEEALPVRPVLEISGNLSAADALNTLIRERIHLAIVKGDGGRTTGLVTLEDVVEELLGDIRDEFDRLPRHFHVRGEKRWLVGGGIRMNVLASGLGHDLPFAPDQPLAEWLEERIDGPFGLGSTLDAHGLRFVVRRIRRGSLLECEIVEFDGGETPR
ncbi:MAG: CNNM domain-containing protein [Myxococcota bacterium]|jgi:CBS domain containing-hemolysin-like protein|nr:CNNM domain-containing protein [Myxococcota bacterium]